ncbi:hypothetical protein THEYE_A1904 [Thermodesulfovibrio yellowstonii DSM 11347]|uniref:Uncharacterized protein n=1 Tax=Thermodesulfovibrio yellowstonii (strain ATCC 51303 / DSM 11347 / YP87) TaxID=289376 RepID=B5YI63_THEYD|nr:hypothetical protein THEYE_A1904 [Thermodesulfovibrio yellowstonii DSM 11347]
MILRIGNFNFLTIISDSLYCKKPQKFIKGERNGNLPNF